MLVAVISPVKFSKIVFAGWNFVRSLKFYYKNNFCQSLLLKSLEIRLFYRKLNSRKRGNSLSVFHRNSPKYSNDQRGKLNSTDIDSNFTAKETQDYAPLQRQATNNQVNSHNFKTLNWIYLQRLSLPYKTCVPCHINLRWLIVDRCVKKAKDWRLPLTFRSEIQAAKKKSGPRAVS